MNTSRRSHTRHIRHLSFFALFAMMLAWIFITCSKANQQSAIHRAVVLEASDLNDGDDMPEGLSTTLTDVSVADTPPEGARLVEGEPLSDSAVKALYARLEFLPTPLASQVEFALRSTSKPPPRTGETIENAFPPDAALPAPSSAAKQAFNVLRVAPKGPVDVANHVSLTFSTSAVALSGQADAAKVVPATIEPAVDGSWRWVGTQTALFSPNAGRFPMATEFTVTPDASLTSANGTPLESADTWTFVTPTLRVKESYPLGKGQELRPLIFLSFNQDIHKETLLEFIELRAGRKSFAFETATPAEIAADERVKQYVARADEERWIAIRPARPLPAATAITVAVKEGAPSAEGSRKTGRERNFSFRTFDALEVVSQSCESSYPCQPHGRWYITFNNALERNAFAPDQVSVSPPVEGLEIDVREQMMFLTGRFKARTTYTVTLDASIRDVHEQKLGENTKLTFHIDPAAKQLGSSAGIITTLDPALKDNFVFYSTNYKQFRVRAWRVQPSDWAAYLAFLRYAEQHRYERDQRVDASAVKNAPGTLVFDEVIDANYIPDEMTETSVDLQRALNKEGHGHVMLWVQLVDEDTKDRTSGGERPPRYGRPYIPEIITWVQATDMALHAFVDGDNILSWTSQLSNGAPIKGVEVTLDGSKEPPQHSAKDGLATLALPHESDVERSPTTQSMLIATKGSDVAFLPEQQHPYGDVERLSDWKVTEPGQRLLWYVFDDRGMYQPGEEVHVKGWVRRARVTRDGNLLIPKEKTVDYRVRGPRGNTLASGDVAIDASGGFDFAFRIADDVNLGYAHIMLSSDETQYGRASHQIQIQEFRRPEFEVSVTKSDGPYIVGESADLQVAAQYYAGGGLSAAPVTWTLRSSEGRYAPPGNEEYTFGRWNPWWWWGPIRNHGDTYETFQSTTDAGGEQQLNVRFDRANPALPMTLTASAAVQDVNRQTWQGNTELLIHPGDVYVGIKSDQNFIEEGKTMKVDAIVTDIDGEIQTGYPIRMHATRFDWKYKDGRYQEVAVDSLRCDIPENTSSETCVFQPEKPGAWRVRATAVDKKGRLNMSELRMWVGAQKSPPQRRAQKEDVRLIPQQESYAVGDTAKLMVLAPFPDAEALMTVRQGGIVSTKRFKINGDSQEVFFKITSKDVPNVYVQVDLVGSAARTDANANPLEHALKRPAWASGSIALKVPPVDSKLDIEISPEHPALRPGAKTYVDLQIYDASGAPAADAYVALVAVDEAILALSNYTLRDPLEVFFQFLSPDVHDLDLHSFLILASNAEALDGEDIGDDILLDIEEEMAMDRVGAAPKAMRSRSAVASDAEMAAPESAGGGADQAATPIEVRKDFNPLAAFAPVVRTDANGKARVGIELPDNLTRYRLMAVATHGVDRFGAAEENMTARLPLMVRPSPPRFLNFGDVLEVPVVLQNQTDEDMDVQVALRASNLKLTGATGKLVRVPANDRIEVRFPAEADMPGTAHIQVAATSGGDADASTHSLPVWTPATTEAFATYGAIDGEDEVLQQPVAPPSDALAIFGGLEITTSSTAVQSLTDALIYLVDYPFNSAEQLASRILGVAALRDVLEAFEAEQLPDEEALKEAVQRDLKKLGQLQRSDGGFNLWSPRPNAYRLPFVEVHVVHALWRAAQEGFEVDKGMLASGTKYIEDIRRRIPDEYSVPARNAVRAYAAYVLNKTGKDVRKEARELIAQDPKRELTVESMGWLMSVLKDDEASRARIKEFTGYIQNRIDETAGTAQFTRAYDGRDYVLMNSDRRTDAIVLDAWMKVHPQSDLIPKVVRGLQAHRTRGHWRSTQENVFVLLALEQYFKTFEDQTPEFVANMWLGEGFAGSHAFEGREVKYENTAIPMKFVVDAAKKTNGSADLTLQKTGVGRLYYRLGMNYALKSLQIDPAEYGFAVTRTYEGLDNEDDVRQLDDGSYEVKLGSRVRVTLTMVAPARRYHVALVDKLPAGFEALNPALAVAEDVPSSVEEAQTRPFWWWFSRWYTHQNLRTERAEAFSPLVRAGTYEYSYVARATTPGTFVVPPAKVEEMYFPETFGRTGSTQVVVK